MLTYAVVVLHQVVVHSAALGVRMSGEARVKLTNCLFRDLEIAGLSAGSVGDSGAEEEAWVGDSVFYGPAPVWAGSLRPARLVGDSEWCSNIYMHACMHAYIHTYMYICADVC